MFRKKKKGGAGNANVVKGLFGHPTRIELQHRRDLVLDPAIFSFFVVRPTYSGFRDDSFHKLDANVANSFSLYFEGEIDCSSTVGYHNKDVKENSLS